MKKIQNETKTDDAKISKGDASRKRLVSSAAELFWKQGYNATGLSEILADADLPKGSLYFYFKSKKELALAAEAYYEEIILSWFHKAAKAREWNAFAKELSHILLDGAASSERKGCPLAVVGTELALTDPETSHICASGMDKLRGVMREILLYSGVEEQDAERLSARALAAYEGRLMLYRLSNDFSQLQAIEKDLTDMYQCYLRQSGEN